MFARIPCLSSRYISFTMSRFLVLEIMCLFSILLTHPLLRCNSTDSHPICYNVSFFAPRQSFPQVQMIEVVGNRLTI
ncbi:hypothetical protein F5X99DRAFT_135531 [Biscogniauxia marginata]|nr:hypothetical protein F5X99DRAFT_135531 [Biscogniauxia marginata]